MQGQIAIGSGGLFGHGLGASIQKIFYVPEAHTDFILAVIGEELGLAGILALLSLYGIIGYAGLRTARNAKGIYSKLLAGGLTSLILCQATAQRLRGPRPRAADRRPAAVHLLRLDVADRAARRDGPAAQRRRAAARRTCAPCRRHARRSQRERAAEDRDRGRGDGGPRGTGDRGRRRAAS